MSSEIKYKRIILDSLDKEKENIKNNILSFKEIFEKKKILKTIDIFNEGTFLRSHFIPYDNYANQLEIKRKGKTIEDFDIIEELYFCDEENEDELEYLNDLFDKIEDFDNINDAIIDWFINIFKEIDLIKYKKVYITIDSRSECFDLENNKYIDEDSIFE